MVEEMIRQVGPARGHEIDRLDRAQADDVIVTAAVTGNPDRLDRQKHDERLRHLVVQVMSAQLFDEYVIGQPQGVGKLLFYFTEDANPEPGPGKGMPINHFARNTELDPDLAHFVLEQFAQGFDQVEFHLFRQAADIVMRLDQMRLAGSGTGGFDHVRINRALGKPPGVIELARFFLEDIDEQVADRLALVFGIGQTLEFREETIFGIDADDMHAHVFGELRHHLVTLAITQQTGIDKNTGQLIADGLVQQRRDHRRIDATGQPEHDFILSHPRTHVGDRRIDYIGRGPLRGAAADLVQEARIDRDALARVRDFGVKLQPVDMPLFVGHPGNRRAVGTRHQLEPGRQLGDPVAVRHPYVEHAVALAGFTVLDIAQQLGMPAGAHAGVAKLGFADILDSAAELLGDGLHAVTDTEDRYPEIE